MRMSFEISIAEFNRQFQLYQKNDRYNLSLYQMDINHFIITFFNVEIEDLDISFSCKEKEIIREQILPNTTFCYFFENVENTLDHNIYRLDGYFREYDLYFHAIDDFIEINYIKREMLFTIVDQLLNGMDCNYKSRLKTELLLNMEFE